MNWNQSHKDLKNYCLTANIKQNILIVYNKNTELYEKTRNITINGDFNQKITGKYDLHVKQKVLKVKTWLQSRATNSR